MSNLRRTLIRNALFGGGGRLLSLLVGLALTPYLLLRLGTDRFAIWALLGVVTGMVSLGDLSFKTTLIRYLAADWAAGDQAAFRSTASGGFLFCLVNALVLGILFFLLRDNITTVLNIPAERRPEAGTTLLLGVLTQLATIALSIFPALCDARNRLDVTNGLGMFCLILGTALTVAAVESGAGLPGIAAAQLLSTLLFYLACAAANHWLFGPTRFSATAIHFTAISRLLRFGLTLHISTICGVINRQFDKFLLSRWAGLSWVTSYELAAKWIFNIGSFQPFLAATLLPASSQLAATGDLDRLRRLYHHAYSYLFLVGLPPFFFFAIHADTILCAWIGHPDSKAALLMPLLAAGYAVNALSNGMAFVCQGIGRPDIQAFQAIVQLACNLALSLLLFSFLGPYGAAIGTSAALIVGAMVFMVLLHRHLGISSRGLLRSTAMLPLFASAIGGTVSRLLSAMLLPVGSPDRWSALASLVAAAFVFTAIVLAICLIGGQVDRKDLVPLRTWLGKRLLP